MTSLITIIIAVSAIWIITSADGSEVRCILLSLPESSLDANTLEALSRTNLTIDGEKALEFIFVDSRPSYALLLEYISAIQLHTTLSQRTEHSAGRVCQDVLGVVGDIDAKTASAILRLSRQLGQNIKLVISAAPSTFLPPSLNNSLPNVFHLKPLSHYIEAIVSFIRCWNWTRVGVIADDTTYYQLAAEMLLLTGLNKTAFPYIRISNGGNFARVLSEVKEYKTHIFVIFMRETLACYFLEQLNISGLTWPEYAWIILDLGYECTTKLEGAIVVKAKENNFTNTLCSFYGKEIKDLCK